MSSRMVCKLAASEKNNNPRNSEGSFAVLANGRIVFYYSRYCGTSGHDHANADIAFIYSDDGGTTWSEPEILFKGPDDGNIMSISLLRLLDGRLMMAYCKKQIFADGVTVDCRPRVRFSSDDGATWSDEQEVFQGIGYFVLNNDRVIQCSNGRIIIPLAFHNFMNSRGIVFFVYSDDGGASWHKSDWLLPPSGETCVQKTIEGLLEPGIIELDNGVLMSWQRTPYQSQFKSFSIDGGASWSAVKRAVEFPSQQSPLSMKKNPYTGEYIAVWNDLSTERWGYKERDIWKNDRCRLVIARSSNAVDWHDHEIIEYDIECGYCYTAIHFLTDGGFLLAYCCGGYGKSCLCDTGIRKFTK